MAALLDRTGSDFSLVVASRSAPSMPLGGLRSRATVSRIDGKALCFDERETDRLFRDAYHQPLEPDVVVDLVSRTEGWAALIALVHANMEGRSTSELRNLVRHLSGATGDLWDYLTEEVLDHVPEELARFLVRASLLESVDPENAVLLTPDAPDRAQELIRAAEALGLLTSTSAAMGLRFAPLVREYLLARLTRERGPDWIRETHLSLATCFAEYDWRSAAHHYRAANEPSRAAAVIQRSLAEVLGSGQYRAAADLLSGTSEDAVVGQVLRSRLLLQVGAAMEAREAAKEAVGAAEAYDPSALGLVLQNAASVSIGARQYMEALEYANRAVAQSGEGLDRDLAFAHVALLGASGSGSLPALVHLLERLLTVQRERGHWHHVAITSLNLAQALIWLDRASEAMRLAGDAEHFLRRSSQGYELVSAKLAQAQAEAHMGRWDAAEAMIESALASAHPNGQAEAVLEAAALAAWFGPDDLPGRVLSRVRREFLPDGWALHWSVLDLLLEDNLVARRDLLERLPPDPSPSMEAGAAFRWHFTKAQACLSIGDQARFEEHVAAAERVAEAQKSPVQQRLATLLRGCASPPPVLSRVIESWSPSEDPFLGVLAREIVCAVESVSERAFAAVGRATEGAAHRWRAPLRAHLRAAGPMAADRAATLLERIGQCSDVQLLKDYSRLGRGHGRTWSERLARRLAPRAMVEDLGPVSLSVGDRIIDGRAVRRKVLALLAFLVSQPNGSATPDRVMDALWPDLDPEQGSNSIHQTIYFLRRVLDPGYRAGVSPEYVHFDAEVIWLDQELVACRSWECQKLLNDRRTTREQVDRIMRIYRGRFAADFPYEDWASAYRENLHARFLGEVERAISGDVADLRWRLWVGQQVLGIDPEADAIEAHVIRLYRQLGAPAAAAEQYSHYASVLRDQLGIDPPSLEDL